MNFVTMYKYRASFISILSNCRYRLIKKGIRTALVVISMSKRAVICDCQNALVSYHVADMLSIDL